MFLQRDLLNKAFKVDAREKEKLLANQTANLPGQIKTPRSSGMDSARSSTRALNSFRSASSKVTPGGVENQVLGAQGEPLTARGTIIRNL